MKPKESNAKLRISYSLLDLWKRRMREEAVKLYLHVGDREETDAMKRGTAFDTMAKEVALKEHRLPDELGGTKLEGEVTVSEKLITEYVGFFLSAELDIKAGSDIIELKCSEAADSAEWLTTGQVQFYLYVAHALNLPIKRAIVYRYDPAKRIWDMSIMYPSQRIYNEVESDIATYGPEILQYFKEEGVI